MGTDLPLARSGLIKPLTGGHERIRLGDMFTQRLCRFMWAFFSNKFKNSGVFIPDFMCYLASPEHFTHRSSEMLPMCLH